VAGLILSLAGLTWILARLILSLAGLTWILAGLIWILARLILRLAGLIGILTGLALSGLRLILRYCAHKGASPRQRAGERQRSHGGNVGEIALYRLHEWYLRGIGMTKFGSGQRSHFSFCPTLRFSCIALV